MSLGLGQAFPQPGPRPRRSAWRFRRRARRRPQARLKVRWKRVLMVVAVALALLTVALAAWHAQSRRSPFAGLLPADAPLVVEGETSAVLEALRRSPEPGPQIIKDFGLSGALGSDTRRVMVAVFPGSTTAEVGLQCRHDLTRLVESLETAWEKTQDWPASLPAGATCPAGGQLTYRQDGQDYILECRGSNHHVVYDSRIGFLEGQSASPVFLVAVEKGKDSLQASMFPGAHRDLRLFCNDQEQLNRLLSSSGPRLELPGPATAPLRLTARAQELRRLMPLLPQAVPGDGRVEIWGDPASGRLSVRLPLPRPGNQTEEVKAAQMLAEMPQAPVVIAGAPSLMRLLGLEVPQVGAPRCLGIALATPLVRGQEQQQMARVLSGREAATLQGWFDGPEQTRTWVRESALAPLLAGNDAGGEIALRPGGATLRLGPPMKPAGSRPVLPAGPSEAELAGWADLVRPGGASEPYSFCAGWDGNCLWLEVARQATRPEPQARIGQSPVPTLRARY